MATSQNPLTPQEQELREQTRLLDEQALKWRNILNLRTQIKKAAKEESLYNELSTKLSAQESANAQKYAALTANIEQIEKNIAAERNKGTLAGDKAARNLERQLRNRLALQEQLGKTEGGYVEAQSQMATRRKAQLEAERNLIRDINKERGIGGKIMDLFRSKEERQRQIDLARARVGGGINRPPGGIPPTGNTPGTATGGEASGDGRRFENRILSGLSEIFKSFTSPVKALGDLIKDNLLSPLKQVSGLVSGGIGGGFGVGGGAISGAGATSILSGFQDVASKIPFIGGLLGGLIGVLKGVVDLVLGFDQGITNFARNLGISKDRAKSIKEEFRGIAEASNNIVINDTRLLESQSELTKALGVRSRFSSDILQNNIKLKEIAGLELATRQQIVQTSILQNKSATQLTKSILAQSKAFEFQTGVAFEYRQVLGEATKQAGALGLIFSKYPERLTKALMTTKAMGFELKQLDGIANSFLDFEKSISKEMEAQVLTGREMNLTAAREAALNNDLVTLAKEINTNVGSTADYLKLNRIQQDAIAESVGMTRDSLAEALKQQEYYQKLGATNIKQAQEELRILKQRGYTQAQISKMIGEDAYNYITQTSTAERLTETMNRIKTVFIEFVEKSGILDFITNPQKIQAFAQGLIDRLAGAVEIIGSLMSGLANVVGKVVGFFGGDSTQWEMLSDRIQGGSTGFAGSLRQASATLGGMPAPSIGATIQGGVKMKNSTPQPTANSTTAPNGQPAVGNVYLDGYQVGSIILNQNANQIYGLNK